MDNPSDPSEHHSCGFSEKLSGIILINNRVPAEDTLKKPWKRTYLS
jgi:hypothetical protein